AASHFTADPLVRATTAPLTLQVRGRAQGRENWDMCGDYVLAGTHFGRPAYQKPGTAMTIRFWPPRSRWLIDRNGFQASDACVAFTDSSDAEHPGNSSSLWYVFESSRGLHLSDPYVDIIVPACLGGGDADASSLEGFEQEAPLSSLYLTQQKLLMHEQQLREQEAAAKDASFTSLDGGIRFQRGMFGA
ncbi:unnamed protein product, partial [Polarella glacialis]